jgi:hypothetical protein
MRLCRKFTVLTMTAIISGASFLGSAVDPVGAAPPAGQTYVGTKKCASCHFEQYMTWKKHKHALSFEILPAKYRTDATCLKCHSTGFGEPTGFTSEAATPDLVGNTCENCHGAGSEHVKIAEKFAGQKSLSDADKKLVRESTVKLRSEVCAACHMGASHRAHEKIEKN